MIKMERFEVVSEGYSTDEDTLIEKIEYIINQYINTYSIRKEDIIEYRTRIFEKDEVLCCEVIMTYWSYPYSED